MKAIVLVFMIAFSAPFETAAQDPSRGGIRGRVTDAVTGEAIADAEITLRATGSSAGKPVGYAVSGDDGRFAIPAASGRYTLNVQRLGYFAENDAGTAGAANIPAVAVAPGAPAEVRVALMRAGVIAGRVIDSSGRLLPRANVQALTVSYKNGTPALKPVTARVSDDRGEFRLFWLVPGEYVIQAVAPGPQVESAITSPKAFYPNAPDLSGAMRIAIKAGDEVRGVDIAIPATRGNTTTRPVKISGQVLSTLPGGGRRVPAAATLLLLPHAGFDDSSATVVGNSDSNTGLFEISSLPAGTYDLYARVADPQGSPGRGGAVQAWGRTQIHVQDRDLENVVLVVHPSVNVNGVVKVSGTAAAARAGSDIRVGLEPEGSATKLPNYESVRDRAQSPAGDGSFTIPAVAEGHYQVRISGLTEHSYVLDVRQGEVSVYESGMYVGEKPPQPIEVMLGSDGAVLEGTAAPSSIIVLVPAPALRRRTSLYRSATADAGGRFRIAGIRPGEYTLFASRDMPEAAYQNAEFLARIEAAGKAVTLAPSAAASIEVPAANPH